MRTREDTVFRTLATEHTRQCSQLLSLAATLSLNDQANRRKRPARILLIIDRLNEHLVGGNNLVSEAFPRQRQPCRQPRDLNPNKCARQKKASVNFANIVQLGQERRPLIHLNEQPRKARLETISLVGQGKHLRQVQQQLQSNDIGIQQRQARCTQRPSQMR